MEEGIPTRAQADNDTESVEAGKTKGRVRVYAFALSTPWDMLAIGATSSAIGKALAVGYPGAAG